MLVGLISKYLLSNKRLVVPNLGAFIVKSAGESVLFSNLMKSDDGVLRHLLVEEGLSELVAAGLIDRFVFEVNYRLQNSGECVISGLGRLKVGANGSLTFEYDAAAVGENLEGEVIARKSAEKETPSVVTDAPPTILPQEEKPAAEPAMENSVTANAKSAPATEADDTAEAARKVRPEKYAKGLRYGKGRKVVMGRESAAARRSHRGDIIIKIAIAVALLAIAALLYGLYNDWQAGKLCSSDDYASQGLSTEEMFEDAPEQIDDVRNPDLDYITPKQ